MHVSESAILLKTESNRYKNKGRCKTGNNHLGCSALFDVIEKQYILYQMHVSESAILLKTESNRYKNKGRCKTGNNHLGCSALFDVIEKQYILYQLFHYTKTFREDVL